IFYDTSKFTAKTSVTFPFLGSGQLGERCKYLYRFAPSGLKERAVRSIEVGKSVKTILAPGFTIANERGLLWERRFVFGGITKPGNCASWRSGLEMPLRRGGCWHWRRFTMGVRAARRPISSGSVSGAVRETPVPGKILSYI